MWELYTVVKSTQPFINKWPWHMAFGSYMYMYDSRAMAESFRYHPTILFFFTNTTQRKTVIIRSVRKSLGYFVWKITILRQKIIFFAIAEGGAKMFGVFRVTNTISYVLSWFNLNIVKFIHTLTSDKQVSRRLDIFFQLSSGFITMYIFVHLSVIIAQLWCGWSPIWMTELNVSLLVQ
jgi:hypothetical protein